MSKVSISGDTNGTGNFTIKAPDSNTDRTLTLPDEAGSVLTDVSDIETQVKTATNATGSAPIYACRAWVNFQQDGGGIIIRDSANVSSVTDNGQGWAEVNLEVSMDSDDYVAFTNASTSNTTETEFASVDRKYPGAPLTDSGIQVTTTDSSSNIVDAEYVFVAIFG